MTSETRRSGYLVGLLSAAVLSACSAEPDVATVQQPNHGAPIVTGADRAFIIRASQALLGRPPLTQQEVDDLTADLTADGDPRLRRAPVVDALMAHPDFTKRWTNVLMDILRVSRRTGSEGEVRTNRSCFHVPGGAVDDATLASELTTNLTSVPATTQDFTMQDVFRASVNGDKLLPAFRANLFAQLTRPVLGNFVSEANRRSDFWTRFETSYVNRQQLCLSCHSTNESVTSLEASGWDRHAPMPHRVEVATLGSDEGQCQQPPDLHSDFRVQGYAGVNCGIGDGVCATPATGERPWQMSLNCGRFDNASTEISTCITPIPDPLSGEGLGDPCFSPQPVPGCADMSTTRRVPRPQFAADGGATGSAHRLDNALRTGAESLAAATDLQPNDPATLRDMGGGVNAGPRAFALMTAANVAERVWNEVFGYGLTLAHHFPRHDNSRDRLFKLAIGLVHPTDGSGIQPWSLKYLLKTILLDAEFDAVLRHQGDGDTETNFGHQYGMGILFNPWVMADPRPEPDPNDDGECVNPNPSFFGCVAGIIETNGCTSCHGSTFDITDPASLDTPHFRYEDVTGMTAIQACEAEATDPSCNATGINCMQIASHPGAKLAVRVHCAEDAPLRMPRSTANAPRAPLSPDDKADFLSWVISENNGVPPDPVPPPDPILVEHNSIGDRVQWKSAYQLTFGLGSALGLNPWPQSMPQGGDYPRDVIMQRAGHYVDDTITGGRGFSILGLLGWERDHSRNADAAGDPCRLPCASSAECPTGSTCTGGACSDRIDTLIATNSMVGGVIRALKQSFMGETEVLEGGTGCTGDDPPFGCERELLESLVGLNFTAPVTGNEATLQAGTRKICSVFLKSPLFNLSYVELPPSLDAIAQLASLSPNPVATVPPHIAALYPKLCDGRLDCRVDVPPLEKTLADCFRNPRQCTGRRGDVTADVRAALEQLRLPFERPELDLERAVTELPTAIPSANDPRIESNLLALPLERARVALVHGNVQALLRGRFRPLRRGDTLSFGETLFIPRGAHLKLVSGHQVFSTGPRGMEDPPDLPERDSFGRHRHGRHGHRTHRDVWILLCNGKRTAGTPPRVDPRFPIGTPPLDQPAIATAIRPAWAAFGEAGLTYRQP